MAVTSAADAHGASGLRTASPLEGFRAVDADPIAAGLVAALDEQAALPAVQRLRAAATERLAPRPGHHLLEVGCGTGEVVRALAHLVAPGGRVVGVDPNEVMLAEARRRDAERPLPADVELQRGDATRLALPDRAFDGVWCERVLQHVGAPEVAVAELVRVTRPGGRIALIDTDWGMHAIGGADAHLTARVVESWAAHAPSGRAGRDLVALLAGAGVHDPAVIGETLVSTDRHRPSRPPLTTMAAVAENTGALDVEQSRRWLHQLARSAEQGRFFWAVTMFAVVGVRQA